MFALQISNDFFFNFFYSFEISALGKNLIEIPCRLSFSLNKMSKNDYHIRLSVQSGNFLLISDDSDVPLVDAKVDTLGTVPVVEDWLSYGWTPGMDISTVHNDVRIIYRFYARPTRNVDHRVTTLFQSLTTYSTRHNS